MGEITAYTLKVASQLVSATDVDVSMRKILTSEIRRRMNRYELMDRRFRCKYGMPFEEFRDKRVVEKQGYGFEVESDYCDWEMAVTGLVALKEQLAGLGAAGHA
jgi:hypothetical protein